MECCGSCVISGLIADLGDNARLVSVYASGLEENLFQVRNFAVCS
jgi:hypothetical protein